MTKEELIQALKLFKAKEIKAVQIKEESDPLYAMGLHIFKTIKSYSTEDRNTRQQLISRYAAQLIARETSEFPNIKTRRNRKNGYLSTAFEERVNQEPENEDLYESLKFLKDLIDTAWSAEVSEFTQNYRNKVTDLDADETTEPIDPRSLLEEANKVLSSNTVDDWRSIVKALCLVTGRRPSEILVTANFQKISEYAVIFTGQLKAKREIRTMNMPERVNEKIIIPTLATIEQIENGINLLTKEGRRKDPGDNYIKTCENVDKQYSSSFSQFMKGSGQTLKDMRKVYAVTTYELFGQKANKLKWFARILGHKTLDASQSYVKFSFLKKSKAKSTFATKESTS
ncbi:MAG: hypothetical protein CLLPBCKN_006917 [Chroococcidiopsis cubana SAG 39.79]|uniref:Telomere resolvase ResT/TelK catalytic domain-containing protein n=1 Tax=Chroococcidiopsis cubana SAG 39.79 TaxID=388085 RepID=A0AB37UAC1_9CYAN|nr:protelomerase family protein [Chroococcidiopsis cubana]MDZ4877482.1 hypothetical protein [Chroococcidiopsis cubana SAG 39.79]PSB60008.1 hypothetical protein C7B79_27365 [Chroococcidiopsis cubana CCALA 043]RUT01170.1 hypothetical protein DSM107010_65810 [Chroococcidiopsis cubana SAG 39.79]